MTKNAGWNVGGKNIEWKGKKAPPRRLRTHRQHSTNEMLTRGSQLMKKQMVKQKRGALRTQKDDKRRLTFRPNDVSLQGEGNIQ